MRKSTLLEEISTRGGDIEAIAAKVVRSSTSISEVFEGLSAEKATVTYDCAKVLRTISERNPRALYPWLDHFVRLLEDGNKILQWNAIFIIANLSCVDSKGKVDRILDTYLAPIRGTVMITAANVIKGAATIASARPHLTERIVKELLSVENAKYQTDECRNVALGHVIEAFDSIFEQIQDRKPVLRLVRRQEKNTRNATRRKAKAFLRGHNSRSASDHGTQRTPPRASDVCGSKSDHERIQIKGGLPCLK